MLLFCLSAQGASERPRAGQGVLLIKPSFPEQVDSIKTVVLYANPGIGRIAEIETARLPSLFPAVLSPVGVHAVAVWKKKGDWFLVAYDEAGRKGWIRGRRSWRYSTWSDFLPGRTAVVLPDLRADLMQLRLEPSESSPSVGQLSVARRFRILELRNAWVRVRDDDGTNGWFRWYDGNEKLLLSVAAGEE